MDGEALDLSRKPILENGNLNCTVGKEKQNFHSHTVSLIEPKFSNCLDLVTASYILQR